ncbi:MULTISPECIES: exodeoxyribonuclease VII small subunit [Psychrilyobacter]|uniref:Exodeoxyribonuclease 7 small subunit n=1 Tax=Psychrilyobacter piezotolerans TaxID=2293438 RepID=A0ABX9KGW4_9FUSO|nr:MULTISPECIES: exodeoxyribonuclease VII small subunit [Psychrilyobacter]MCS5420326.1 exodeoxyribonuclease VII small subunit [Psychrilyobacter sp. S5]NDI78092.1 exodeoxyribonuclease VII small subunit [Psychrilyobacter piezotolerans]RDE61681.1 exodeoxyribonuclease VII small subunit [Psychrilyobacter sp. S5]REI41073.1 exodeoxyribonuclease VII small subunit [Psychrilyobacter piezotolerans]
MAKIKTFEENISEIDEIISKLEDGMDLDESMKEYEIAMKLLAKSGAILEKAEGKIKKVMEKNGQIIIEDFE